MKRSGIIASIVVLLLAVAAEAGRKDDFEFAQGLVQRKYYDLAREEFEKIISDKGRPATQRADGELGLALLLKAQAADVMADSRKPIEDTLKVLSEAESRFEKFLEDYPSHPRRTDAKFEVGSLLQMKGDFLARRIQKDPSQADAFSAIAEEAFDQAIDLFRDVAEQIDRNLTGDEDDSDPLVWDRKKAMYFRAVTYYSKGMLHPAGSAARAGVMQKAIQYIDDFVWENEDNILGGYAYLFYGLTKAALDDPDGALEMMLSATNYDIPDPAKYPRDFAIWSELILKAYFKLGEYGNEAGRRGDRDYRETVILEIENMQKRVPNWLNLKWGHFAMLEYARAQMGIGNFSEAKDTAATVSRRGDELAAVTEWGATSSFLANRLLNEIIAEAEARGEDLNLPPTELFQAALGKQAARHYPGAIRAYQSVIRACKKEEEKKEFLGKAWMRIGSCYYLQEKFLEAYFAYDYVMRNLGGYLDENDQDLAGSGAYWRYRCASMLHAASSDPEDEALKKAARGEFAKKFPEHPRSIDLQYYEGADFIGDGDAKAGSDKAAALEAYNEALERLEATKPTSILYAKALARWGEVYYKLERYQEALKKLKEVESWVNDPGNVTTDATRKANRRHALAIAAYFTAQCYGRLGEWDKDLKALEDFEKKYDDPAIQNFHAHAMYERIRAYVQLGQTESAEREALTLRQRFPDHPRTPPAFSILGKAFHTAAMAAKSLKEDETYRALLSKAAQYYSFYLGHKTNPTWEDWKMIGVWYKFLDDGENAEKFLEMALKDLNVEIDTAKGDQQKAFLKQAEGLSVLLSEILLKQGKYAKAKDFFEGLLIPKAGARQRVKELLLEQTHSKQSIKELMEKIRAVPSFMEGLARAYKELGSEEDLLRALTLIGLLARADKRKEYTAPWWEWQYLILQIYLDYGISFSDKSALSNVVTKYKQFNSLGVLETSGIKAKFTKIKEAAERELRKLGGEPPRRGK